MSGEVPAWVDAEMARGAEPFLVRLFEFSAYKACPRTADGTATPEHHKARMLVHMITERGYECVAAEMAMRPGMPKHIPYPSTRGGS